MMKKLRTIIISSVTLFLVSASISLALPVVSFAVVPVDPAVPAAPVVTTSPAPCAVALGDKTAKALVLEGSSQAGDNCSDTGVTNIGSLVVNTLSIVAGVAAVIVVLLAGFKYITAAGDSGKITSAKNTLVYAIIGLVIAALAQVIVRTVFTTANSNALNPSAVGSCSSNTKLAQNDPTCK